MSNKSDSNVLRSFIVNCALEEACVAQYELGLKQKSTPAIPARGAERPCESGGARQEVGSRVPLERSCESGGARQEVGSRVSSKRPCESGGARQEAKSSVSLAQAKILEFAQKGIWSLKYDGKFTSDLFTAAILEIKDTGVLISTLQRIQPLFEKVYGNMIREKWSGRTFQVHSKYQLSLLGCAIRFKSVEVVKYLRTEYFKNTDRILVWHLGADTHNFVKGARELITRHLLPHASNTNLLCLYEYVRRSGTRVRRVANNFLECIKAELNKRGVRSELAGQEWCARGQKRPR